MRKILIGVFIILLTGCTSLKVAEINPATGYFPGNAKAAIVKSVPFDLDSRKSLILVPNDEFLKGQIENIGYFDTVINFKELERIIISEGLEEKVPSLIDAIGVSKASKSYKPFLWFRFDTRRDGQKKYAQFILTDPLTLEEIFITEKYLDYVWAGVNDRNTWYPMFNSFIDYIKENSKTYK